MEPPRIIIDTSVLVSALRSKRGASYRLLMLLDSGIYQPVVSVALVLEYEAVARRLVNQTPLTERDIEAIIDFLCAKALTAKVYYLWRPTLKDPNDDMVLEAAVAAACTHIVTYNKKDFAGAEQFGINVLAPREFLEVTGGLS